MAASSVSLMFWPSVAVEIVLRSIAFPSPSSTTRCSPLVAPTMVLSAASSPVSPWPSTPTVPMTWPASLPSGYTRRLAGTVVTPVSPSLRILPAAVRSTPRAR